MIDRLFNLLTGTGQRSSIDHPDDLQVAIAALLVEAAGMDDQFGPAERLVIERLLAERFALPKEATERLLATAERAVSQSSQLFRFTHLAAQELGPEGRVKLIEMLWEVAYADGVLDANEDALLRKIAGLIYVPDKDRGEARKRVLQRLGLPS